MEVIEVDIAKNYIRNNRIQKCNKIPVIDANVTSYQDFFENFLLANQACVIRNVGTSWEASKYWIENDSPNFSYLNYKYGHRTVTVQDCNQKYYNSQLASKWVFKDYLEYWESYIKSNYMSEMPLYYLKDWHLRNEMPTDNFYNVPVYFSADWLNEYLIENCLDDYRFVYMGPKNTWTPLHADVMTTYSWSTNICGQKRWMLFPPGEENTLRDNLRNLPYDITDLKLDCTVYEIIQNPGEAVFVPSNWHHQVWNLKDTVSINHNWINACNILSVWHAIENNLRDVKREIEDCKGMEDFTDTCQIMLKASFGMNFEEFYKFLSYISKKRIDQLQNNKAVNLTGNRILGNKHAIFDLEMLRDVLVCCLKCDDIRELNIDVKIESLLINMDSVLQR